MEALARSLSTAKVGQKIGMSTEEISKLDRCTNAASALLLSSPFKQQFGYHQGDCPLSRRLEGDLLTRSSHFCLFFVVDKSALLSLRKVDDGNLLPAVWLASFDTANNNVFFFFILSALMSTHTHTKYRFISDKLSLLVSLVHTHENRTQVWVRERACWGFHF